jgi:hypothetical protein
MQTPAGALVQRNCAHVWRHLKQSHSRIGNSRNC